MPLYRRWVRKHRAPTSADAGHCENRRRSTSVRRAINRPNIMIKVVATSEGVAAVEALIGEGINVNITLMFSLRHYEAVANAYLRGLERCREPAKVASVASFFVSRVDTDADRALEAIGTTDALALRGKVAIANAKMAYHRSHEIFHGEPFRSLRRRGAHVQRRAMGEHEYQEPELPRRNVHRRTHRSGYSQHDSARHAQGVSRPRAGAWCNGGSRLGGGERCP